MSQQVRFSPHAAAIYLAAQGSEVLALCAYAIETQDLDKKSRVEYNRIVSEVLGISLKTMQNRASVAVKLQDKLALVLAPHVECTDQSVRDFSISLIGEMKKANAGFTRTLEDIKRFLEGKLPEKVEIAEAKERAEAAARVRKEAQAAADKKQAEEVAQNQADMSGAPKAPSKAAVQSAGATVGNADKSENRGDSNPEVIPPVEKKNKILLIVEQASDGALELEGLEDMSLEQIEGLMKFVSLELEKRTKKAA